MRMKYLLAGVMALMATVTPPLMAASAVDDDFSDGAIGPQWTTYAQAPLSLSESGGRLSLISAGGGVSTNDALYLSTFQLSTASSFSVQIGYSLDASKVSGGASGDKLGLTFGVGRDIAGTDSAAIGVGFGNLFGSYLPASTTAYRVDNVQTDGTPELGSPLTGTFQIDYNAGTDVLTLSRISPSSYSYSLPAGMVRGTLATQWAADSLYVSFGGRGSGMAAAADGLYLTNFKVLSGNVVPEPACLTAVSVMGIALLRRRGR